MPEVIMGLFHFKMPPRDAARPVGGVQGEQTRHRFAAIGSDSSTFNALVGNYASNGPATRSQARQVPSVIRARSLLVGTASTWPLHAKNSIGERIPWPLVDAPERDLGIPRVVSLARLLDDLWYAGSALWVVRSRDWRGFPASAQRIDHGLWDQDPDTGVIRAGDKVIPEGDSIVFISPLDPFLTAAGPAIRAALALEARAADLIAHPRPLDEFSSATGVDPDPEVIQAFLDAHQAATRDHTTIWRPADVQRDSIPQLTAAELQLSEARRFADQQIARAAGLDPADVGAPVDGTSEIYKNLQDARLERAQAAMPLTKSVEERLSMPDCTPLGTRVLFNLSGYLRADVLRRYEAHRIALDPVTGWMRREEVRRDLEDLPAEDEKPEEGVA